MNKTCRNLFQVLFLSPKNVIKDLKHFHFKHDHLKSLTNMQLFACEKIKLVWCDIRPLYTTHKENCCSAARRCWFIFRFCEIDHSHRGLVDSRTRDSTFKPCECLQQRFSLFAETTICFVLAGIPNLQSRHGRFNCCVFRSGYRSAAKFK